MKWILFNFFSHVDHIVVIKKIILIYDFDKTKTILYLKKIILHFSFPNMIRREEQYALSNTPMLRKDPLMLEKNLRK
jgi:hypothetical protein